MYYMIQIYHCPKYMIRFFMKLMKVFFYRIRVRITPSSSYCATAAFPFLTIGAILSAVEFSLETKINKVYIIPRL